MKKLQCLLFIALTLGLGSKFTYTMQQQKNGAYTIKAIWKNLTFYIPKKTLNNSRALEKSYNLGFRNEVHHL